MLRVTADVNGRVIGRIFVQNIGETGTGACLYDAAVTRGEDDALLGIEGIVHARSAGWGALVRKVLARPKVSTFLRY